MSEYYHQYGDVFTYHKVTFPDGKYAQTANGRDAYCYTLIDGKVKMCRISTTTPIYVVGRDPNDSTKALLTNGSSYYINYWVGGSSDVTTEQIDGLLNGTWDGEISS